MEKMNTQGVLEFSIVIIFNIQLLHFKSSLHLLKKSQTTDNVNNIFVKVISFLIIFYVNHIINKITLKFNILHTTFVSTFILNH
jgi:hypothetical protein